MDLNAEEIIINHPPYSKIYFTAGDVQKVSDVLFYTGKLDCYCPYCGQHSIFNGQSEGSVRKQKLANVKLKQITVPRSTEPITFFPDGIYDLEFICTRVAKHRLYVFFLVEDTSFSKVGMSPSLFDIREDESRRFRKLLGDNLKDLRSALLLNSNGFCVAAFTHLRRVIENYFLKQAYEQAKAESEWNDTAYKSLRFAEKLKALKHFLPESLVGNAIVYNILSKGIHELNEEDCALYFNAVKTCLILSLEDILAVSKRKESEKKLREELAKINQAIN